MEKPTSSEPETTRTPPPYSEVGSAQNPTSTASVSHVQVTAHPQHHGTSVAFVPTPAVITQQPETTIHIVTASPLLGPNPTTIMCNTCGQKVTSRVILQRSPRAHLCALALCLIGFWPCSCLVYCMDCCMNTNHYCSRCNAYQGTYLSTY